MIHAGAVVLCSSPDYADDSYYINAMHYMYMYCTCFVYMYYNTCMHVF